MHASMGLEQYNGNALERTYRIHMKFQLSMRLGKKFYKCRSVQKICSIKKLCGTNMTYHTVMKLIIYKERIQDSDSLFPSLSCIESQLIYATTP